MPDLCPRSTPTDLPTHYSCVEQIIQESLVQTFLVKIVYQLQTLVVEVFPILRNQCGASKKAWTLFSHRHDQVPSF